MAPPDSGFDLHKNRPMSRTRARGHVLQGVVRFPCSPEETESERLSLPIHAAARGDGPRITYPTVVNPVNSQLGSEATIG
jgi:hypothetical protein